MQNWIVWATISMLFAGMTSVIAKLGLSGISGELGLTIRTAFVALFILIFALTFVSRSELSAVSSTNILFLGASGLTTAISWVFY